MGFVTSSNEASLVGTMTSDGTDVIVMSASTAPSTTGAADVIDDSVSADAGIVGTGVEAAVVAASAGALGDPVASGSSDEVVASPRAVPLLAHAELISSTATRQRT